MAVFKCKMCGGQLEISDGSSICTCEFCGTNQTIPKVTDENVQGLFNRANILRMKAEFDRAADIYEKIIQIDNNEAEAYWGLVLCKNGIEYVEDPVTFKRVPTCHRASYDAITYDDDYKMAIQYADVAQKALYESEAKQIDDIQKNIIALAQKEEPYDIFICYKETSESGSRTQDSVIANDIYYQLTQEGYKVFYSAISLEDKLGQEYEPYIFSALNSAKVMLVVGTKPEYLNAVWVKNEWSRFMKLMKRDRTKILIPCYKDMDAYELPEEFAHLQAQDMGKIGFIRDLVRGISKVVVKEDASAKANANGAVQVSQIVTQVNGNALALVQRGNIALEDGEWEKADSFFEEALNNDAQNAEAYIGKVLAHKCIHTRKELLNTNIAFEEDSNFKKAIRFGTEALVEELNGYIEAANNRKNEKIYNDAIVAIEYKNYKEALKLFLSIGAYRDSKDKAEECERLEKKKMELEAEANAQEERLMLNIVSAIKFKQAEVSKIRSQIESLKKERDELGIFAGKRKKEIEAQIVNLNNSIELYINDNNVVVDKEGSLYGNVTGHLNNDELRNKFMEKYPEAYFIYKNMDINEGTKVSFGHYGNEEIVWRVLEKKDNRVLLLADKVIDAMPYSRPTEALWERSYMKIWLNKTFINQAFGCEKKLIATVSFGNNQVTDKIFLLNSLDASRYFKTDYDRICFPTEFAMKKLNMTTLDSCAWWLRITDNNVYIDTVMKNGHLYRNTEKVEAYANWGVRPAMWIELR